MSKKFVAVALLSVLLQSAAVASEDDTLSTPAAKPKAESTTNAKPPAKPVTTVSDDDEEQATPAPKPKAESGTQAKPAAKLATPKKATSKSGQNRLGEFGKFVGGVSKRGGSVAVGTLLGMPIAACRVWIQQDGEHSKGVPIIGESEKPASKFASHIIAIPTSFFSAAVGAPIYSAVNAWRESEKEPFSKETFFLGDITERMYVQ